MWAWAMAGVRTAIQAGWAQVVLLAAAHAAWLPLPADPPWWLDVAATALVIGAVTSAVRWLESRSRGTWWGKLATRIGRGVMLGIVQQPTGYAARGKPRPVPDANGGPTPARPLNS
jgi:hypothetical protein